MPPPPPDPRATGPSLSWGRPSLPYDAAFAALDEFDERPDFGLGHGRFLELLHGRLELQSRAIQRPIGAANVHDLLGGETATLQADRVDAVRLCRPADGHDIGWNIARHRGIVRDEAVRAHLGVLMHRR